MGGCCFQSQTQMKHRTMEKAYNVFKKIALTDRKIINKEAVEQYFTSYSQSSYDILMRQIDFNKDGIITQNQWMAYWEYIRVAGYDYGKINKQLNRIQKGQVSLDFPKAKNFQPNQPRITLVNNIISNMKSDSSILPFLQNLTQQST